jgi:hypothetical protein
MTSGRTWRRVSKREPCPVCQHDSWCSIGESVVRCKHIKSDRPSPGDDGDAWLHPLDGASHHLSNGHVPTRKAKQKSSTNWGDVARRFANEITSEQVQALAKGLGVNPAALTDLGLGWSGSQYTFPMFADDGSVCGIRTRSPRTGEKKSWSRCSNGILRRLKPEDGLLLVCEGESDTAAALTLGFDAVGVPGAGQCAAIVAAYARGRDVAVARDNDTPGKEGAMRLAQKLLGAAKSVRIVAPPSEHKDLRAWLNAGAKHDDVQQLIDATVPMQPDELDPSGEPTVIENNDPRPQIELWPGTLTEVTRQAEQALLKAKGLDPIYQRASELVRIVRLPKCTVVRPGTEIAANTPIVMPVAPTRLRALFELAAQFVKWDGRVKAWVLKDCPDDVPALYLQSAGDWRVPRLTAVVTAPTLRPDGTVLQLPGYDPPTGIVFDTCGTSFPTIPESPSLDDARAAVAQLVEPVRLFPWASPHDRSIWLAALLTVFVRPSLSAAPMILFDATVRGSGKTILARLASLIPTGHEPALMIHVDDDNEQRKRLFALLRRGVPVLCIDNIDLPLESASLCVALTSPVLEDRVLGESRTAAVSTCCTMIGSGNNLHVVGDLTRRVLICRIDPQVERPEERRFDFDPIAYALQHRPRLVAAVLTLLRAHAVAGWPADGLSPLGSFGEWSTVVRGALTWVGEPDPVLGQQAVREVDDEHDAFAELLRLWHLRYGSQPMTIRQAITGGTWELVEAIDAVTDGDLAARAKRLGERIAASRGRIFDGLRFVMEPGKAHGKVRRWRVEEVKS